MQLQHDSNCISHQDIICFTVKNSVRRPWKLVKVNNEERIFLLHKPIALQTTTMIAPLLAVRASIWAS